MKKIIGLIMIAGISYGASVVTPPGIQVNGLATNNNVMVYSNGMLLDSGVAPTNLVSVTNLTAVIEALQANSNLVSGAVQDSDPTSTIQIDGNVYFPDLVTGDAGIRVSDESLASPVGTSVLNKNYADARYLYATGTTNKTLIDAAIAAGGVGDTNAIIEEAVLQAEKNTPSVRFGDFVVESKIGASDLQAMGVMVKSSEGFTASPRGIMLSGQSNAMGAPTAWTASGQAGLYATNVLSGTTMLTGIPNSHVSLKVKGADDGRDPYSYTLEPMQYVNAKLIDPTNNWNSWGVELPLGQMLSESLSGDTYWYKAAVSQSPITKWINGGTYWAYMTNVYEVATNEWAEAPAPSWYIWMQGEAETPSYSTAIYKSYQKQLISDVRTYFGNPYLKIILAGVPADYFVNYDHAENVDQAKLECANEDVNVWFASMRDIQVTNGHYSADALIDKVAPRFYDIIINEELNRYSSTNGFAVNDLFINGENISDYVVRVSGSVETNVAATLTVIDNAIVIADMSNDGTLITNYAGVGGVFAQNGVQDIGFDGSSSTADYLSFNSGTDGIGLMGIKAISNSNFSVFQRIRTTYDVAGGGVAGYGIYVSADPSGTAFSLYTKRGSGNPTVENLPYFVIKGTDGTDTMNFPAGTTLESNEWHTVGLTIDRSTSIAQRYFDGVSVGAVTGTYDWASSALLETANYYPAIGCRIRNTTIDLWAKSDISLTIITTDILTPWEMYCIDKGMLFYKFSAP